MCFALMVAVGGSSSAPAADEGPASSPPARAHDLRRDDRSSSLAIDSERITDLIRQLGHPRYTARRSAANQLRQIGPEAFDLLHAAASDPDPEVAASARYLLRQITVRWVRTDDPPGLRRLLLDYGNLGDETRTARVAMLARLDHGEGAAGLCRIARFDRSPLVSRQAALAVIRPEADGPPRLPLDPEVIEQELGSSTRVAAAWLRQYARQARDPASSIVAWQSMIAEEMARLEQHTDETSTDIALGLLWNLADLNRELGRHEAVVETADQMIAIDDERRERTAVDLVEWMAKHKSWNVLDGFLSKHQSRLEQAKRPLYAIALARAAAGKNELADQLAERAVGLDPQSPLEGFMTAKELEEHNQFEWAKREYRRVLDKQKVIAHEAILARIELADMLFDHNDFEAAADTLFPLVKALQENEKIGQLYAEIQRYDYHQYRLALPDADTLACRYHAYRAGQYRQLQDWQRERDELQLAIKFDKTDADVLIAMYRVPEADDAWRASVRQQIARRSARRRRGLQPVGLARQQHGRRLRQGRPLFAPLAGAERIDPAEPAPQRVRFGRSKLSRHARPLLLRRRRLRKRGKIRTPGDRAHQLHAGHAPPTRTLREGACG
jgi:hypothetical protein